jgi:hypothetical protein
MKAEPQKEHQWLQKLVGDWTFEAECPPGPDGVVYKSRGAEVVRPLGDFWVMGEGAGEMPDGSPARMVLTIGFDAATKRFVGTWIGSMMSNLWVYDGELDASGNKLHLYATGPNMAGSGEARYRETIEMLSHDHRTFTSHVMAENGEWQLIMSSHYHRRH